MSIRTHISNNEENLYSYYNNREDIYRFSYVISLILFYFLFWMSTKIHEIDLITKFFIIFLIPVASMIFQKAMKFFWFKNSIFNATYSITCVLSYFIINWHVINGSVDLSMDLLTFTVFSIALGCFFFPILWSIPIKAIHFSLGYSRMIYYDVPLGKEFQSFIEDYKWVLRRRKVEEEENKMDGEDYVFQTMNETELQIRLNQAVGNEDYELAEKIRKIIKEKF
jgi:hypothetical protein